MIIKEGSQVFIKNPKLGKYLFYLRDDKPTILYPNTWSLFGGGIEKGESPLEAALREVKEETNVAIYDIKELGNMMIVHKFKEDGKEQIIENKLFAFLAKTDATLNEAEIYEGQALQYFTIEEAKKLDNLSPPIREAIGEFEELLK